MRKTTHSVHRVESKARLNNMAIDGCKANDTSRNSSDSKSMCQPTARESAEIWLSQDISWMYAEAVPKSLRELIVCTMSIATLRGRKQRD